MGRRWVWIGGVLGAVVLLLVAASLVIDEPLRRYVEAQMNERLDGYTVRLGALDFHPLDFSIDFRDLVVTQDAHPDPPVASLPRITAGVQWHQLLRGALVADFALERPAIHVNLAHLRREAEDEVPVERRGWQEAVKAMYPLEINQLTVEDGRLTHITGGEFAPLTLSAITARATNIRNIASRDRVYPSTLELDAVVFEEGRLRLSGNADFLAEPHPGVLAQVELENVRLDYFRPVLTPYHLAVRRGVLSASGNLEYSPAVKAAHLETATLIGPDIEYAYVRKAPAKEKQVAREAVRKAEESANRPGLQLRVDRFQISDGRFVFVNRTTDPAYRVFVAGTDLVLTNLSNHLTEGTATLKLTGQFMGTGDTTVTGTFRPEIDGPDFDLSVAVVNTRMRGMNDLFQAYGNFDVAGGLFSFFSELSVKNRRIRGYVKPLFRAVDVYEAAQDEDEGFFRKAWERLVGAVAKVLENRPRDEVATETAVEGPVQDPRASTWQVIANLIQNAFFEAILPGFQQRVGRAGA